jgi:hypothetical protein
MNKSFYFQHDYNASNDFKILFLRQQLGIEAYGIYWYIIEQLAQSNGRMPLKIVPVIAMQIQTTADKVSAVIKNYDLFTIEDDYFFSIRLLQQIEWRRDLSKSGKLGGLKSAEIRKNKATLQAPLEAKSKQRKGDIGDIGNFERWGDQIVNNEDQYWEQMKGRKVLRSEMDSFISVAVRNKWKIESQQEFRISLRGFKSSDIATPDKVNYKIQ